MSGMAGQQSSLWKSYIDNLMIKNISNVLAYGKVLLSLIFLLFFTHSSTILTNSKSIDI